MSAPGGSLLRGVSAREGVCSGVSAPGGLCSGGCLLWGGGVCSGGCAPGGVCSRGGGGIPVCTEADPPVNRMTDRCKNITLATTSLRPVKIQIG